MSKSPLVKRYVETQPIEQGWVHTYVEELLEVSKKFPERSGMQRSAHERANAALDLLAAWRRHLERSLEGQE